MILYIPKYFTLEELTRSDYRYSRNIPNFDVIYNLSLLCKNILDPLREIIKTPLLINSAYRDAEVNRLAGGVPNSLHKFGYAADICSFVVNPRELFGIIEDQFVFTELGLYNNFVHVAYDPENLCCRTFNKVTK